MRWSRCSGRSRQSRRRLREPARAITPPLLRPTVPRGVAGAAAEGVWSRLLNLLCSVLAAIKPGEGVMRIPASLTRSRNLMIGGGFAALLLALGAGESVLDRTATAQAQGAMMAPRFEVDPLWPKPLPNHWVLGSTTR